jgi:peptidase E
MTQPKGKIVLMGSGELTATMVEVHKALLNELNESPRAVFIDTPAGFQLNVDQLSQRAVDYFTSRVQHAMSVVSFKSHETTTPYAAEKAFHTLREADFILIGPGSPTYAVRQWQQTPIPEIITRRVAEGACLVAASAAALTVGRFTLPVYEIYKVGEPLHWIDGMDILGKFGFDFVVIPHWNNAEGGTHDTRFCYMGEPRFNALASDLPPDVSILGLDEHTACIIDLAKEEIRIRGIGTVTLRRHGSEMSLAKGECYPMGILYGEDAGNQWHKKSSPAIVSDQAVHTDDVFWERIHTIQSLFEKSLETKDLENATNALLELDGTIWKAQQELENTEFISQGRDLLRDMIVLLGTSCAPAQLSTVDSLAPVIKHLLTLRNRFRQEKKWQDADAIRTCLAAVNIVIEDTADGSRWQLKE